MNQRQYRHIRDKEVYTVLFQAFNVETQKNQVVYINRKGQIFTRNEEMFLCKFEAVKEIEQYLIEPREPHP